MSVIANDRAKIIHRLADAISEVTRKPNTVRMNSIWSCIECEADRKQLNPDDRKKYEIEEKKLREATGRRKELKVAFDVARLFLEEDEAVYLGWAINCLPDIAADAWTHIDYVDGEVINKMDEIANRLRFRADKEQAFGAKEKESVKMVDWEYENIEGTEKRKAGGHMVSRGKLAEEQRLDPNQNSFRELLEIYPERKFYPTLKIQAVREAKKSKKLRLPSEAVYDMTDWFLNWKPPGAPNWKHPGKRSTKQG